MEFTTTGIRYHIALPENCSNEERTLKAEEFIRSLKEGETVDLKKEPDNRYSNHAVAVYRDFELVGYISDEEAPTVNRIMGESDFCEARITRTDNHVTFFVELDEGEGFSVENLHHHGGERKLPQLPELGGAMLPFSKEENKLELIAQKWLLRGEEELSTREQLQLMGRLFPLLMLSLCHFDAQLLGSVEQRLKKLLSKEKEPSLREELELWIERIKTRKGDFRRVGGYTEIYYQMLGRLEETAQEEGSLFGAYDRYRQQKELSTETEKKRLREWLLALPRGMGQEFLAGKDEGFAYKLRYANLSRREMYDVLSVVLIMRRLEGEETDSGVSTETKKASPQKFAFFIYTGHTQRQMDMAEEKIKIDWMGKNCAQLARTLNSLEGEGFIQVSDEKPSDVYDSLERAFGKSTFKKETFAKQVYREK